MRHARAGEALAGIVVFSAALYLLWENAQAPLYAGYQSFWQHFWMCLAVIPGDVTITVVAYLVVALWKKDFVWVTGMRFLDAAVAGIAATLVTGALERYSLAVGRWSYSPLMPVLPFVAVGWTPVLQMLVIPPLTFYCVGKLMRKNV